MSIFREHKNRVLQPGIILFSIVNSADKFRFPAFLYSSSPAVLSEYSKTSISVPS